MASWVDRRCVGYGEDPAYDTVVDVEAEQGDGVPPDRRVIQGGDSGSANG